MDGERGWERAGLMGGRAERCPVRWEGPLHGALFRGHVSADGAVRQERDEAEATAWPGWFGSDGFGLKAADRPCRRSVAREARRLGRAAGASQGEVTGRGPKWTKNDGEEGQRRRVLRGERSHERELAGEGAGPVEEPGAGIGGGAARVLGELVSVARPVGERRRRVDGGEMAPKAGGRSRLGDGAVPGRQAGRMRAGARAKHAPADGCEGLRSGRKNPAGRRPGESVGAVGEADCEVSREQLREMRLELAR